MHALISIIAALTQTNDHDGGTIPLHRLEMERSRAIEQDKNLEVMMQRSVIMQDRLPHHGQFFRTIF